ncbi:MAG: DUF1553 domain-containing protein [Planctomycetes bacterium]|nr:DUF1553 domain-containing protein [Planctomycetota bacterium]
MSETYSNHHQNYGPTFYSYWIGLLSWAIVLLVPISGRTDEVDFNREVRPILSKACFHCHGPDAENREADLRLDTEEGLLGEHAAIVPGKPEDSSVMARITSSDPDERMPPADSGEALSSEEVALIQRWIEAGAKWSQHWAFVPPRRPELPTTADPSWNRNPIDAFVQKQLEESSLRPSPEVDRTTLLRRLSLDLIGLPPTPSEVDAFLADQKEGAYQRQVNRLLASPHYGEHWGKLWLDAARYADSDGFEKDLPRNVWFYRDWVIHSLNADLPYDQFIIDQIAGDLLPNATQDQRVATGFLRNSMVNEEGGIDPEQFRMEAMFDRMDAVGTGILGLTVRCSQCHSHKFDPITQKAYYQMFAFLNNCNESQIAVYGPEQQQQRDDVLKAVRQKENELQQAHPDWAEQMAQWEKETLEQPQPEWVSAELEFDDTSAGGQKFILQADGSYLASGYSPIKSRPRMLVKTDLAQVTAIRYEVLPDPNLPLGGPGRSLSGTFALTEFEVVTSPANDITKQTKIDIAQATADYSQSKMPLEEAYDDNSKKDRFTGPIEMAIDRDGTTAWGINSGPGRRNQARKAVFNLAKPIELTSDTHLSIYLSHRHGGSNGNERQANGVGRFRISLTADPNATADPLPLEVRNILSVPGNERTEQQRQQVFSYWRTTVSEWQKQNQQIEELWKQHPEGTSQLVVSERTERRKTYLLERGDFLSRRDEVSAGVPDFMNALSGEGVPPRLAFAKWLVARDSPTTARAIANRVWQAYFGIGIVRTTSDLGSQGEPPSHLHLLDWLAVELMDHGWSLKHLHRQIVNSATYRQSSDVSEELASRDPDNRLLARGPRFRVRAETVRDIALHASGLINLTIGGPSVYPPSPEILYKPPISYGTKSWKYRANDDSYRRAMYTFMFRSVPYPTLETFDAPKGESACVRRSRSNTPLQALTILNEPLFMECAKALALLAVREGGEDDNQRLTFAFRQCVARLPTAAESKILLGLLQRHTKRFAQQEEVESWKLAVVDPTQTPELPAGTTPAELAAWTAVSRVLLNLDETICKE